MKEKILENLEKGRYIKRLPCAWGEAYVNREGWTDHLLSERILFSHRANDYTVRDLSERLHAHDFYELVLVAEGEGLEYIADGQSILLRRGMAILTKPLRFHMYRLTSPRHYDRYLFYFKDVKDLFPDKAIFDFTKMGNESCAVFEMAEGALLPLAAAAENALAATHSPYSAAKAGLSIGELFLTLSDQKTVPERTTEEFPHFIHGIKQYIDENFLKIHSVEELAKQFFYSREYISRSFRKYYNIPIYEYVLERRMLHCASLLRSGENVESAARHSGFGNMSSFTRLFRKFNGCTPSEYKAKEDLTPLLR